MKTKLLALCGLMLALPAAADVPAPSLPAPATSAIWTRENLPDMPEYQCRRALEPMKIDGRLDELSWQQTKSTPNFFAFKNGDNKTYKTFAKLLWDDKYLYVAFHAADPDIRATRKLRDDDVFNDDCVELFVMEQYYGAKYNHFLEYEVNAYGTRFDDINIGIFQGITNWDSKGWQCAVQVDGTINNDQDIDKGWTVEMAIPFRDFYSTVFLTEKRAEENWGGKVKPWRPRSGDRWRLNLYRLKWLKSGTQYFAWSPTHMYPSSGFHEYARWGTMAFSDLYAGSLLP